MKRIIYQLVLAFIFFSALGQAPSSKEFAETITQGELRYLLNIIASDSLEGRDSGSMGQKLAASFIEKEFKSMGLQPIVPSVDGNSFMQKFFLENYDENAIYLQFGDNFFSLSNNVLFTGRQQMNDPFKGKIVFIYGENVENYGKRALKGKIALISTIGLKNADYYALAKTAYSKGSETVIFIPFKSEKEFKEYKRSNAHIYVKKYLGFGQKRHTGIPNGFFLISPKIFAEFSTEDFDWSNSLISSKPSQESVDKFNQKEYQLSFYISHPKKRIDTENVLGFLEGSDKKDEVVVIMAHYDHLGRKEDHIFNGADDNGSGTTAVLEIAEAFALAKKAGEGPRRSFIFLLVSAEEIGLIGSNYYTTYPVLPLSSTVAALNLDMIGRHDEDHELDRNFVYVVGADKLSSELNRISKKANKLYTNLYLDYSYNDKNHPSQLYYRSDHWSFAKYGIPVIFYFSGLHYDYHKPTDTVDKIEYDMLQKRAQLVFHTAWILANSQKRLVIDKPVPDK